MIKCLKAVDWSQCDFKAETEKNQNCAIGCKEMDNKETSWINKMDTKESAEHHSGFKLYFHGVKEHNYAIYN